MSITRTVFKFGQNPNIGIATDPEDVWNGGGIYTGHPSGSPETINIVSSSTADNGVTPGTGALTIQVEGLLTALSESYTTENFTLNGTTPVVSTSTWYRINRCKVLTAGSGGQNAGTITVNHSTTTANVFCVMPATYNQTSIAAFTIPANNIGAIRGVDFSASRASGAAGSATVSIRVRDSITGVYQVKDVIHITTGSPASEDFELYPIPLPAGADVKLTVEEVSDNATLVSGDMKITYRSVST